MAAAISACAPAGSNSNKKGLEAYQNGDYQNAVYLFKQAITQEPSEDAYYCNLGQAMNTGMDGSLSTGHGNSPSDMLVRLETMVLMGLEMPLSAVRRQIASGIDILIHLGRLRDKSRRVLEIREVTGYDYESGEIVTSVLYEFLEDGKQKEGRVVGKLHKKEELFHVQKLIRAGIVCQVHGRLT